MNTALRTVCSPRAWLIFGGAVVGLALLASALSNSISPAATGALLQKARTFVGGAGPAGPLAMVALVVLSALSGLLPVSLLAVAAGAIFGLLPGFLLAASGCLLGAATAFRLSRSLFRPLIERRLPRDHRLHWLDERVSQDGWKIVCLLRLSPVVPFSVASYLLGLSSIGFRDFLGGTLACLAPLFCYVLLGTLGDVGLTLWAKGENPLRWGLLEAGVVATLLLAAHLARLMLGRRRAQSPRALGE